MLLEENSESTFKETLTKGSNIPLRFVRVSADRYLERGCSLVRPGDVAVRDGRVLRSRGRQWYIEEKERR